MEHFAPHPSSQFEGYYSKFRLPSGASIALIVCTVPQAKKRPHMVSFSYVSKDSKHVFQRELWADHLQMVPHAHNAFDLRVPGIGNIKVHPDSTSEYTFDTDDFSFHGKTTTRTAWSEATETPESMLVYLPLPLHWHVQSLSSDCDFDLSIPSDPNLPSEDKKGTATVHQEKNWANSFPSAHIWVQARTPTTGICIAGGKILGMEAYLAGYRSSKPQYSMDWRPPLALRVAYLSPSMSVSQNWDERSFEMSLQTWTQKMVVKAQAPKGTFFSLSSPFADGHRENFLAQSFATTITVQIYEAGLLSGWQLKHEESFEHGSLEFGGGYYPPAGTDERSH